MGEFNYYLELISREPLLTPAEELELGRLIQAGEKPGATPIEKKRALRAKNRMVAANIRLAVNVAKKYHARCKHLDIADLTQEATLGLVRAAEKFNPQLGYKFSTYSYGWIRQSINRAIENQDLTVRVPSHVRDQFYRYKKAQEQARTLGLELSPSELAKQANVSLAALDLGTRARNVSSLNFTTEHDTELISLIPTQQAELTLMEELGVDKEVLTNALNELPLTHLSVIKANFGLDNKEPESLESISKRLKISREATRKRRDVGTRILRHKLLKHGANR